VTLNVLGFDTLRIGLAVAVTSIALGLGWVLLRRYDKHA